MSTSDAINRRIPGSIRAGIAVVVVALVVLAVMFVRSRDQAPTTTDRSGRSSPPPSTPEAPAIEQSPWRIHAFPAGVVGGITKKQRSRVRAQKPELGDLVRNIYDALLLQPRGMRSVLRGLFTPRAGRAFAARSIGVPAGATKVKTLKRDARIGIDSSGARRAVASIEIAVAGRARKRSFRVRHEATLWLARTKGKWRVISFDVRQRPLRRS
ncbi:MAG: hypothetical protein ABR529_04860 [Actinomycetota bacterium]